MASATTAVVDLSQLLQHMSPVLHEGVYVFATIPQGSGDGHGESTLSITPELLSSADMLFRESEGWTIILLESDAKARGLQASSIFPSRKITLNVHSSLDAVGFLAAITTRLAERLKIGVNPVSAYHHDHLFVPLGSENAVMAQLEQMSHESRAKQEQVSGVNTS